ncbi:YchJ family protein [bacterium]|nr:MAG: YchJ family protein [bacterium]
MVDTQLCPCGSSLAYIDCCEPIIKSNKIAQTAEELMRSRYSAYAKAEIDYLLSSTDISQRHLYTQKSLRDWAEKSQWLKLEILSASKGQKNDNSGLVEFKAYYNENGIAKIHHELSTFVKKDGHWYFQSGSQPEEKTLKKIGRNDVCLCGSGKKYKKCCL